VRIVNRKTIARWRCCRSILQRSCCSRHAYGQASEYR